MQASEKKSRPSVSGDRRRQWYLIYSDACPRCGLRGGEDVVVHGLTSKRGTARFEFSRCRGAWEATCRVQFSMKSKTNLMNLDIGLVIPARPKSCGGLTYEIAHKVTEQKIALRRPREKTRFRRVVQYLECI